MATVRVTAPYVTLQVTDATNASVLLGYYEGAIVENVEETSARHHIEGGMAEEVEPDAEPASPPFMPQGGPPVVDPAKLKSDAPSGNASRDEWEEYARRARGAGDADLLGDDDKPLSRNELAEKFGTPQSSQ